MRRLLRIFKKPYWLETLLLTLISGFTYLPRIGELLYYRDDWYFLYGALVSGPRIFIDIALHTRPIRGPLYALYYTWFGLNPFPYHIVEYLTRLAGGLAAIWLFNLLWPGRRQSNFYLACLFIVFPGFMWWVSGFEFQPYVLSVSLQVLSIAFTLKAIQSEMLSRRATWTIFAIFSGWIYLALVEYAIGMEAFRILCIYLYIHHQNPQQPAVSTATSTLKKSAIFLIIPTAFFIWYQFFFDNWRKAQDASVQIIQLISSPVTLAWRSIDIIHSILNVTIMPWFVPFQTNFPGNRLRDILLGMVFTLGSLLLLYWAHKSLSDDVHEQDSTSWNKELLLIGLLGALAGVFPVVFANRVVAFERTSQYTLPASLAGIIFFFGLLSSINQKNIRFLFLALAIGLGILSQHGLAARAVREEKTISEFWWQVIWRAPEIKNDTLLVALYPELNYLDENDIVWGPANFIYADEFQGQSPINVPIAASRLEQDSKLEIIRGERNIKVTDLVIKNAVTHYDYQKMLIMSQPIYGSCMHTIDPRWPDISINDDPLVHASYQNSKTKNISTEKEQYKIPTYAIGAEPPHQWCYYYQKADLARQKGDWDEIIRLAKQAEAQDYRPVDQVEWMPFLQAYALAGDVKSVKQLSTVINTHPFYRQLACQNFTSMQNSGYQFSSEMSELIGTVFCKQAPDPDIKNNNPQR